jgi:cytochrome c oxidase subunit 1
MAVLVFLGFNITFVPQFLLGNLGMPRRYFDYPESMQWLHVISTGGSWLLGVALLTTVLYLAWAVKHGTLAGDNPWHSAGFEWRTASPPPAYNFPGSPVFHRGAYDYGGHEPPERPTALP